MFTDDQPRFKRNQSEVPNVKVNQPPSVLLQQNQGERARSKGHNHKKINILQNVQH